MKVLEGKQVILTGANRGIGLAILRKLARSGANVWACARTQNHEFEEEAEKIAKENGVRITPVYFDLSDESEIKQAITAIFKEKIPVDVLINNAGMAYGATVQTTPLNDLKDVFQINYFSQIYLSQLVSRNMIRNKSGAIVNLASVGGMEATEGYLAYGSSKAALIYATKVMAKELGGLGIRVNAVAPGLVDTTMGHFKDEDEIAKVMERVAMKRMALPDEIADAVVYLSSEQAAYVTGHVLVVDGGRMM